MAKDQKKAGIIISYMDMIFTAVIGMLFTPFALRMLGDSEYGVYTTATAAIGLLTMLDLGFTNAMVRFTAKSKAEQDSAREYKINGMFFTFYSIIALLAIVVGLVFFLNFDGIFAKGLTETEIGRAKIIFVVMLINTAFSFPMSVFQSIVNAYEEFIFLKAFMLTTNVVKYAAQFLVLFSGFQSVGLAVAVTVVTILSKFIPMIYCFKKLHVKFHFGQFDKQLFLDIINYSFFVFLNIIVDQLNANTDKIVLSALVSSGATAIYNTAYTLQSGIYSMSSSISGVFLPSLTKMVALKKSIREISDIFVKVGRIQFMILAFVMSGFAVFGRQFVLLWTGKESFHLVYPIVLIWLAYSIVPLSQSLGVSILQAQNKHRVRSVIYTVIAVFHVGLTILLSKEGSILGEENRILGPTIAACCSNLLGQWVTMNIYYKYVTKLDINAYWKEILKITAVIGIYGVCAGLVSHFVALPTGITSMMGGWIALFLGIGVYCIIFVPIAWFLVFTPFERDLVRSAIHKILGILKRTKTVAGDE